MVRKIGPVPSGKELTLLVIRLLEDQMGSKATNIKFINQDGTIESWREDINAEDKAWPKQAKRN